MKQIVTVLMIVGGMMLPVWSQEAKEERSTKNNRLTLGAYYFDGWSGKSQWADDPGQPWAKYAPTHLTRRMIEEFPDREPLWGWRDDSAAIMTRQIDLAAEHGLDFFAFCWYWHDNGGPINQQAIQTDPKHTGLNLFLRAKNNQRLKFCLLVANHGGFEIKGPEQWKAAGKYWLTYFKHPQHLTLDGKPVILIFSPWGVSREELDSLQAAVKEGGLPGVAVAGCGGGDVETGFAYKAHYNIVPGYADGAAEHTFAELADAQRAAWKGSPQQPYIPIITANWDKRPWEGPAGLNQKEGWYFTGRTPEQFEAVLQDAVKWMDEHPDSATRERMALIYAWNELGEGGYLVPTKGDPEGQYLKAIKSVKELKSD